MLMPPRLLLLGVVLASGCRSTSNPAPAPLVAKNAVYPPRPSAPPSPYKLFHQTESSITLVTAENATDEQVEAIVWQLRDAAHGHSFDKLHISQKAVDARSPYMWFHIYRGAKCAPEKYASGSPPCGASYHGAGDFTLGDFKDRDRTDGELLHDENHQVALWNADAPYSDH